MPNHNLSDRLATISRKFELARIDGCRPFGSDNHRMTLNRSLTQAAVMQFETTHKISLPPQYRAFISEFADGGAGPGYGMHSLDKASAQAYQCGDRSFLARPFPHTTAYFPQPPVDDAAEQLTDTQYEQWEASQKTGTLVICDEGCGYEHLLVVSGLEAGTMWFDARVSDRGLHPLGIDFLEWYERWLDDILTGGDGVGWLAAR